MCISRFLPLSLMMFTLSQQSFLASQHNQISPCRITFSPGQSVLFIVFLQPIEKVMPDLPA
jgi:hypothetical protein